jgi:hypothetical protein
VQTRETTTGGDLEVAQQTPGPASVLGQNQVNLVEDTTCPRRQVFKGADWRRDNPKDSAGNLRWAHGGIIPA